MPPKQQFRLIEEHGYREIDLYEAETLEELAEFLDEKEGLL